MFIKPFKLDNVDKIYKNCFLFDLVYQSNDGSKFQNVLIPVAKDDIREMIIFINCVDETCKEIIDIISEDNWQFKQVYDFLQDKYPKIVDPIKEDYELHDYNFVCLDKFGDLEKVNVYSDSETVGIIEEFLSFREAIFEEIYGDDEEEENEEI